MADKHFFGGDKMAKQENKKAIQAHRKRKGLRIKTRLKIYKRENLRRGNILTLILYQILTGIVILVLASQAVEGRYENCFTCALTLLLFLAPNFFEKRLKITLPQTLEVIIILFIFSAEMLGEINGFYLKFSWWDDMLHTLNGFLMAAIGFSMVDILNKNDRFKFHLSPLFIAIVSFCFSMTIGVLWEFFELSMDCIFLTDMQKDTVIDVISSVNLNKDGANTSIIVQGINEVILSGSELTVDGNIVEGGNLSLGLNGYLDIGLMDTMNDLIVNFIGAIVFSIFGYLYIKSKGKGKIVEKFVPRRNKS